MECQVCGSDKVNVIHDCEECGAEIDVDNHRDRTSTNGLPVAEILAAWLRAHGYTGLYAYGHECGCTVEDLAPCDSNCLGCMPGSKGVPPAGEEAVYGESWIYATKREASASMRG